MEKRVVKFNQHQYNSKASELENQIKSYNETIAEASQLTGLDIDSVNSATVSIYAKHKTGFVDLSMSLKALGLNDIYRRLKNVELSGIFVEDCIDNSKGVLSLNKACLRDTYTTYFHQDDESIIVQLERLVDASKSISSYVLQNAILFNRDGGLSINKPQLNNVLQQMRRSARRK